MKQVDNRQVRNPGPRDRDVSQHCKTHGLDAAEERKLVRLLGTHAPLHEIKANSAHKQPRFR